jgi:hypothetical protein
MSDRLVLKFKPPRPMERSDPRVFWAYGVMLSFLFLGWGLAGVVLMVAAQVALGVVAVRYFRQQLEIDQRHVTITHVWSVHRVPLDDVLFVSAVTSWCSSVSTAECAVHSQWGPAVGRELPDFCSFNIPISPSTRWSHGWIGGACGTANCIAWTRWSRSGRFAAPPLGDGW